MLRLELRWTETQKIQAHIDWKLSALCNIKYISCLELKICIFIYTILPEVLAPLLMKGLSILVISMSTNLNVEAYNDILGNLIV